MCFRIVFFSGIFIATKEYLGLLREPGSCLCDWQCCRPWVGRVLGGLPCESQTWTETNLLIINSICLHNERKITDIVRSGQERSLWKMALWITAQAQRKCFSIPFATCPWYKRRCHVCREDTGLVLLLTLITYCFAVDSWCESQKCLLKRKSKLMKLSNYFSAKAQMQMIHACLIMLLQ